MLQRIDGKLTRVEPKTQSRRHNLALPEAALVARRRRRAQQLEEQLTRSSRPRLEDHMTRNVVRHFHRFREQAGLPWLRIHGLRHAYGSLLAVQGSIRR